jgi:hypothetical protein
MLVEDIDERDEALGLVAAFEIEHRNVIEDERMEIPRKREKINRAERLVTQVRETRARHAARRRRKFEIAPAKIDLAWCNALPTRKFQENCVERPLRHNIDGRVIDRMALQLFEAVIMACIEPHDLHLLLDQPYKRQKERPVEPVMIKPRGLDIRRRQNDDTARKESLKQPPQNHRIGNIGDGEFVETQYPGLIRQRLGHRLDRVTALNLAGLRALPPGVNTLMHIGHEGMEMRAPLALNMQAVVEKIDQHGLAPPDRSPEIKPLDRLGRFLLAEKPAERAALARKSMRFEALGQLIEFLDDGALRRIGIEPSFRHHAGITRRNRTRHRLTRS